MIARFASVSYRKTDKTHSTFFKQKFFLLNCLFIFEK